MMGTRPSEAGAAVRHSKDIEPNDFGSPSRRAVLTGAGAALAAPTLYPAALAAPLLFAADPTFASRAKSIVRGSVFEDIKPESGRGIAGVMVSNGRDIAVTGPDGVFSLPANDDDLIFPIKPSGWTTTYASGGVPNFARRAGDGPIDFALRRSDEPTAFDVLLFADTQPSNATELGYFRDEIVSAALGVPAAFGIHHGDVVGDDLTLYGRYLDMLGALRMPWHHCPGNHDRDSAARDNGAAFATWRRVFGPTHYAFEYGPATFILLNNVDVSRPEGYRGYIGPEQLAFVDNVLRHTPADRLIVVSMHIPLTSFNAPHDPRETTADARALLATLSARPNTVSFAGHSHTTEHHYLGRTEGFDRDDPHHHHVLTAASGSWWGGLVDERGIPSALSRDGSPNGYHVLSVSGTDYATRFVPVGRNRETNMRMMLSKRASERDTAPGEASGARSCPLQTASLCSTELVVDVFDGGPRTRLTFEIEGIHLPPQPMRRSRLSDPHIVDVFTRDRHAYKAWVEPAPSSHIWTAPLPEDLSPGVYRLAVWGTDEFGRPIADQMVLDIVA
jgi:3',5'-cyclic AMP phosphodiesterase CpdA